jgi:hypothetical protein
MKKSYSAAFKAQVVLELLKETKTLSQLAAEEVPFTITMILHYEVGAKIQVF